MPGVIGPAYGLSSNYNFEPGFGSGFDYIQAAVAMIGREGSPYSELERDLIHALATRSSAEAKAAINPAHMNFGECKGAMKPAKATVCIGELNACVCALPP